MAAAEINTAQPPAHRPLLAAGEPAAAPAVWGGAAAMIKAEKTISKAGRTPMTTQPKRKSKNETEDDRDPILNAAEDMAQLLHAQEEETEETFSEPEEDAQPADDPSWEASLKTRYGDKTDEEIVAEAQAGDSVALEYLLGKYKNFVRSKARSYFLIGADHEDIVQEGMIGLFKAIRDYQAERLSSFRAFAELCITRQIITAIKTATRQKHVPLNSYVSLNKPIYDEESDRTLMDVIVEGHAQNPEELIIGREDIMSVRDRVDEVLSSLEQEVLSAYLDGKSYQEIADKLGRHVKSIDNALQRVKRKLEKFMEESKAHDDD